MKSLLRVSKDENVQRKSNKNNNSVQNSDFQQHDLKDFYVQGN